MSPGCRLLVAGLIVASAMLGGCSEEQAARKSFDEVVAAEEEQSLEEIARRLEAIISRWPETAAADKARKELEWVRSLRSAEVRGPALLAWDAVRKVGFAAESFRLERGRYPERLEELFGQYLEGPVIDPWRFEVAYRRTEKGYQVFCYGEDGLPGGRGLGTDLVIDTGQVVPPDAGAEADGDAMRGAGESVH
ncbi:MAG: type II secretion system protein GspG [Acidobacteriota bacterium]|nr:type II secretion system protein GspG [Acidobacteriota bacterium]